MPVPHWVRSLEDYWRWLDGLIEGSGGYLDGPALAVRPIETAERKWAGLAVEKQRIRFPDGIFLDITLVIDDDFIPEEYNFHVAAEGLALIWRKDKHEGHAQPEHIHRESEEKEPEPFDEVDLEEVLNEVRDWRDHGHMP